MRDNERIYFGDMLVKLGDLISSESFDEFDKHKWQGYGPSSILSPIMENFSRLRPAVCSSADKKGLV